MATAKQKADWERIAQISWIMWHGPQPKPKTVAFFNAMSDEKEAVLQLNRQESTEFMLKNAPVDRR